MRSPCCLCVCESPPINFWMPEPIFMKVGMYVMAHEPISAVHFINPSRQYVCSPIIATQRLSKNVTVAMDTPATIEELLDTFSVWLNRYCCNSLLTVKTNTCILYRGLKEVPWIEFLHISLALLHSLPSTHPFLPVQFYHSVCMHVGSNSHVKLC
jgi:hypothetical protein